ncbi:hypothetical protein PIB30_020735, partial [Stylosanthes scabra]|nr:hypothetical protein [Stylosanthes scabra]
LGDEILLKIFAKSDPKTAARCRAINKRWCYKLMTPLFAKHNFRENKNKYMNVIAGLGCPPQHDFSKWCVRVYVDTTEKLNVYFPWEVNGFRSYSMIGLDHRIICLKFDREGFDFGIVVWNPFTSKREFCSNESRKHLTHAVSLLAFRHIFDSLD